jgi:hypothetical protein
MLFAHMHLFSFRRRVIACWDVSSMITKADGIYPKHTMIPSSTVMTSILVILDSRLTSRHLCKMKGKLQITFAFLLLEILACFSLEKSVHVSLQIPFVSTCRDW